MQKYMYIGVKPVFKSRHTLRHSLMNVKNRIPEKRRRGIVYEILCAECDAVYTGETGHNLHDRVKEHKYAVKRRDLKNGVAAHAWKTQHAVNWSSAKVLSTEQLLWKRRILKAINIKRLLTWTVVYK